MKTRIGLIGYGRAGQAVARVLQSDKDIKLCWVACASRETKKLAENLLDIPVLHNQDGLFASLPSKHMVDVVIDFSDRKTIHSYADFLCKHQAALISAISAYTQSELDLLRQLGKSTRVMYSPNITLGINFVMIAAKILQNLAPFSDLAILEKHFKGKKEVSGTAKKLADFLDMDYEQITSLRLGGIVGQHEVIFGFPHQTVQMIHNSISREAFGTGAIFAMKQLLKRDIGFYTFDSILLSEIQREVRTMAL